MKTAPPAKESGCRSCEEHVVIRPEKVFEYPLMAEKSVSISVKTFFLEITCFWAEKRFEFPSFNFRLNFRTNRVILIQEQ